MLHKATAAVGIADHARLDHASFRRGWVRSAHREGIPADVARQQTGHSSLTVHLGYMANAVGDDLGDVVERVHARRARHRLPAASHTDTLASHGNGEERAVEANQAALSGSRRTGSDRPKPSAGPASAAEAREADGDLERAGATRRDRILGRLDPVVSTVSRWADEDPEAMRRLLTDVELRAQLGRAIEDVVGPGQSSQDTPSATA